MPVLPQPSFLIAILIALTVHEWAHAFVASRLGDPTGKYEGRLTLNPIAHIDPLGALLFFVIGFGWGKPVPVNPRYFRHIRRDTALVSLAGPVANIVLAFVAFFGLLFFASAVYGITVAELLLAPAAGGGMGFVVDILVKSLFLNLGLMAFNLLPIAPLDGSKVLGSCIPARYEDEYEQFMQYGPYILLVLLLLERVVNFPLLETWIYGIINPILHVMMAIG